MQALWAGTLSHGTEEAFGWKNPYLPLVGHFVRDGVVEIWEHQTGMRWFLDRLLEENRKGTAFLGKVFEEYVEVLQNIETLRGKDCFSSPSGRKDYADAISYAALRMTLFYYTGTDERSPDEAQEVAVRAREIADFFADNDAFVRTEISGLAGISSEAAGVVLPDEVENIPFAEILERRLKSYLLIDGKEAKLGTIDEYVATHPEYVFETEAVIDRNELEGQSACKGVVTGVVRIVRKQSDMDAVHDGDILVSPMTTPDFLPAMKQAAAFVTDEGGITCHASIVAREMGKPCIIGTKFATQVLRDGDLVEVDADHGVVRVVKRGGSR